MNLRLATIVAALLVAGCNPATQALALRCDILLDAAWPDSALPGARVQVSGTPFTTHFDTAVYVGGVRATVLDLQREDCDDCDDCRSEADCNACGDCDDCDLDCKETCIETVTFEVPEVPAGPREIMLFNSHGASLPLAFTVEGAGDTGDSGGLDTADTGTPDTADTGTPDTADTGTPDTADTASPDTGTDTGR